MSPVGYIERTSHRNSIRDRLIFLGNVYKEVAWHEMKVLKGNIFIPGQCELPRYIDVSPDTGIKGVSEDGVKAFCQEVFDTRWEGYFTRGMDLFVSKKIRSSIMHR